VPHLLLSFDCTIISCTRYGGDCSHNNDSGGPVAILAETAVHLSFLGACISAIEVGSMGITELANQISYNYRESKGYHQIAPGGKYVTRKLSLSLWQQCTCVRQVIKNPTELQQLTFYMRPIFSGTTKDSVKSYGIQNYVDMGRIKDDTVKLNESKSFGRVDSTRQLDSSPMMCLLELHNYSILKCYTSYIIFFFLFFIKKY
jgi:hypothetical protein